MFMFKSKRPAGTAFKKGRNLSKQIVEGSKYDFLKKLLNKASSDLDITGNCAVMYYFKYISLRNDEIFLLKRRLLFCLSFHDAVTWQYMKMLIHGWTTDAVKGMSKINCN